LTSLSEAEVMNLLGSSSIFGGVNSNLLSEIKGKSTYRRVVRGEFILNQGQNNNQVFVVMSGKFVVNFTHFEAIQIATLDVGDCFGEVSVITGNKVFANVVAAERSEVLCFDKVDIIDLLNRSHRITHNLLLILSERIYENSQIILEEGEVLQGYKGLSLIDKLTGLYNQQWMDNILKRLSKRSRENVSNGYLMFLEIDGFDNYKQQFGTLAGDQVLRSVANEIFSCLRPNDYVCYHSNAKFCILLSDASKHEEFFPAADRLIKRISQASVSLPSGDQLPNVTVSIGGVAFQTKNAVPKLYELADKALYLAKKAGGNCYKMAV
jgi:diguanylate cyclase (GGDEF)-like protein